MQRSRDPIEDLKNLLAVSLMVFLLGGIVFAVLYRNIRMAIVTYEIERLKKERRAAYIETEELRLQVARHSSADRMEKLFREKYGFLPVEVSQKISTYILPQLTRQAPHRADDAGPAAMQ